MVEAMGAKLKVGDNWAVPLCFKCHDALHLFGDEQTFWDLNGVDPVEWAKKEWNEYVKDR